MKVKLALFFEKITGYFWVIPSCITLILVIILLFLKSSNITSLNSDMVDYFRIHASNEGAARILGSIATAVMTVVGVLFSIILVVLQQVSSQFSPRAISNFSRSTIAQSVLGFYIGTFIYCLILLMSIGEKDLDPKMIPQLAIAFSVVLAIVCLILLVLYVHYVTKSIQSTNIISRITIESLGSFQNVVNDRESCHKKDINANDNFHQSYQLKSKVFGYIAAVDWKGMEEVLPEKFKIIFKLSPGNFVQKEMVLLEVQSNEAIEEKTLNKLLNYYAFSPMRTNAQDPEYGIQKLSDIALKALSPGINDPSTALESIHSITALLNAFLCHYPLLDKVVLNENRAYSFENLRPKDLIDACYDQIIHFGKDHKVIIDQVIYDLSFIKDQGEHPEISHFIGEKLKELSQLQCS